MTDDVQPLGENEGLYQRDGSGEFKPLGWRVIEYKGEKRKIKPYPIPMGDVERLTEMGTDISIDDLCEILSDKVHTPNRSASEWNDSDPALVTAITEELGMMAGGDVADTDLHEQVREELAEREEAPGN